MKHILPYAPLLLPLLAFVLVARSTRNRWLPLAAAAFAGGAGGAFVGAAASAMASAVSTESGMLRGGTVGLGGGLAVGLVATGIAWVWRSLRGTP